LVELSLFSEETSFCEGFMVGFP